MASGCTCKQGQVSTPTSYGGTLDFVWSDGQNSYTWNGPKQFCNPYNCSNAACKKKGCDAARSGFCQQFGKTCNDGTKVCYNETCKSGDANGSTNPTTTDWATGNCYGLPFPCWVPVALVGAVLLLVVVAR